jgi:hypothetical protein
MKRHQLMSFLLYWFPLSIFKVVPFNPFDSAFTEKNLLPLFSFYYRKRKSTLTNMKNRPVFTLNPQGEQAGFSAFIPTKSGPG